jgi:hypothetical protein
MQHPASSVWKPAATAFAMAALMAALSGVGCQKSLPSAPSELVTGITIYEDANYRGRSALLTRDVRDLKDFNGPCEHESTISRADGSSTTTIVRDWNDCISSIRVALGWRAVVYRDDDFDGDSLILTGDASNLQLVPGRCDHDGMNDCITSIRVGPQ